MDIGHRQVWVTDEVYSVFKRLKERYDRPMSDIFSIMIMDCADMGELHDKLTSPKPTVFFKKPGNPGKIIRKLRRP